MTHAEISRKGGQRRWQGTTKEERREAMRELAFKKHAKRFNLAIEHNGAEKKSES